jgi:chemotaxis protein methyltransferase CheR
MEKFCLTTKQFLIFLPGKNTGKSLPDFSGMNKNKDVPMDEFTALTHHIEQTLKIPCGSYKEDYIKRRLLSRMRSTNMSNYAEYLKYIKAYEPELEILRKALTINVTEFFRDEDVYEFLKDVVLPDLFRRQKQVRIWCAGCSTGEESYSIAMILSDLFLENKELSARIYATDIDRVVLARAQDGIYSQKALVKLSPAQVNRHFTPLPDTSYQAKPHLKELIRFCPHDLLSGVPIAHRLDMITCRNVIIYFNEARKDELARLFHGALRTGGYYIMGKTEYLGRQVENLFVAKNSVLKIFVRKG